jgi:hypothetical protein
MSDAATRAANQDIRRWAAGAGIDLASGGRIPAQVRKLYEERDTYYTPPAEGVAEGDRDQGATPEPAGDGEPVDGAMVAVRPTPPAGPAVVVPTPPAPAPGRRGLWRGRRAPAASAAGDEPPRRRRMSLEKLATGAWEAIGTAMTRTDAMLPTGRMMALQAPLVGGIVEDQLKGSLADQLLQPLARASAKGEALFSLLGPPAIVATLTVRPEAARVLMPLLRVALEGWADIAGPQMVKLKAKAERRARTLEGMSVDEIIAALFAPPPGAGAESEGQRAA